MQSTRPQTKWRFHRHATKVYIPKCFWGDRANIAPIPDGVARMQAPDASATGHRKTGVGPPLRHYLGHLYLWVPFDFDLLTQGHGV